MKCKMAGGWITCAVKAEGTELVHSGEEKALVGLNSSFPFAEWKPLRRFIKEMESGSYRGEWCEDEPTSIS